MMYRLLLVSGQGEAVTSQLRIRTLREFPGVDGLSAHFRPVRSDLLFESAKSAGRLAYRILLGEGVVRSQLWVEYEVLGQHVNVMGRSADLLFALALLTAKWRKAKEPYAAIAATGVLDAEGAVQGVERTVEKIAAAVRDLETSANAVIFYPAADDSAVARWRRTAHVPAHLELRPVAHLEDALAHLGYRLEKVYLHNPFRGLEHFGYEHRSIFFGRDREVGEVVEQLLRRGNSGAPGLAVEGASGSGKSSFVQAGLLPALIEHRFQSDAIQEDLRRAAFSSAAGQAIWRPGRLTAKADEAQLAMSIHDCWRALPEFAPKALEKPQSLKELADERREFWPASMRFVWVVDQFEELFDLRLEDALIELFGQFLGELQSDGVWTLASVRSDALPELKRHEALRQVFGANEGSYYLATLSGTALDDVIISPARAAGLTFGMGPEGKPLDQLLREAAYDEKGSLPQLQFTLNELYQRRVGKELTYAAYQELGGLAGCIATTAESVLSAAGPEATHAVPRLFRSLVSVDDSSRATRRYAPMADVIADPVQSRILSRLIETRLCVTDQRDGKSVVAFAHDTLLQTLPALIEWLKQEAGLLQIRDLAQRETQLWQRHDESDAWLAASDKVLSFKTLEAAQIVLPDTVRTFIDRSAQRVRRARRIKQAAISVIGLFGLGLIIGAVALLLQQRRTEQAREMAARRGDFLVQLLSSANPRLGGGELTVAQLIDSLTPQIGALTGKQPLFAASMLGIVAKTNSGLGRYPQALIASTRELELLHANGADDLELSEALALRGDLLKLSERTNEAEPVLREALGLVQHRRGAEKLLGTTLVSLGAVYHDEGREQEAESMYKQAIDVYRGAGKDFAVSLIMPLADMGVLRHDQGRYAESVTYLHEALEVARKNLPPDHPDLLDTEYNYAAALEHDHPAAAEPVFRDLLASYQRVLGPNHMDTLMAQQGLAQNLLQQQRYREAAAVALPAAEGLSKVAGEEHGWTLTSWAVYGSAACLGGEGETGLAALQRVAAVRRKSSDTDDRHKQATDVRIGTCLVALRRYKEAEPLLLKSVALLESERGASYINTQAGYRALHDLYAGTGHAEQAALWRAKVLPAAR